MSTWCNYHSLHVTCALLSSKLMLHGTVNGSLTLYWGVTSPFVRFFLWKKTKQTNFLIFFTFTIHLFIRRQMLHSAIIWRSAKKQRVHRGAWGTLKGFHVTLSAPTSLLFPSWPLNNSCTQQYLTRHLCTRLIITLHQSVLISTSHAVIFPLIFSTLH